MNVAAQLARSAPRCPPDVLARRRPSHPVLIHRGEAGFARYWRPTSGPHARALMAHVAVYRAVMLHCSVSAPRNRSHSCVLSSASGPQTMTCALPRSPDGCGQTVAGATSTPFTVSIVL